MSGDHGPMILLVEDNETIRNAFGVLLEETGYRVCKAATGAEALELARTERPSLVLMDLGLPDMHGLDVTRKLKDGKETQHLSVVALTGRALDDDEEACLAAGCSGYLSKPVESSQLLAKIAEFIKT